MENFTKNMTYPWLLPSDNSSNHSLSIEMMGLILNQDNQEPRFDPVTEAILILFYSVFITFGAMGNGLVIFVVVRNPSMLTPRNIFIINLAISDLTLCTFTQPLNLYLLLYKNWILGEFMCKFVTMAQGTNIFVSTISITAIALDRFQVIVYPTKDSMKRLGAAIALLSIWVISFLMASPALLFSLEARVVPIREIPSFYHHKCMEDPTLDIEKRAYSLAQMVVQYVLPFVILSVAHLRICNKLRYRMVSTQAVPTTAATTSAFQRKKNERRRRRKRKTNFLLAGIAIVFASSWLPLNSFNLIIDFKDSIFIGKVDTNLISAVCHLLVLCSACFNPILYGWLNDNFRAEFEKILCCSCCTVLRAKLKRSLCCFRQPAGVPAITLTKVGNGHSTGLDEGIGNETSLTVQYQTRLP